MLILAYKLPISLEERLIIDYLDDWKSFQKNEQMLLNQTKILEKIIGENNRRRKTLMSLRLTK